eukprot:1317427-Alexandrium_andersonii.AAC.1
MCIRDSLANTSPIPRQYLASTSPVPRKNHQYLTSTSPVPRPALAKPEPPSGNPPFLPRKWQ